MRSVQAKARAGHAVSVLCSPTEIDQLKGGLVDFAIAMSDYLFCPGRTAAHRPAAKEVRDQLYTSAHRNSDSRSTGRQRPETRSSRAFPKLPITMLVSVVFGLAVLPGIAFTVRCRTLRPLHAISPASDRLTSCPDPSARRLLSAVGRHPAPAVIFQAPRRHGLSSTPVAESSACVLSRHDAIYPHHQPCAAGWQDGRRRAISPPAWLLNA